MLVLASTSSIRQKMLRDAHVPFEALPARVDEPTIRASLEAEGAHPRDMADALAEAKARKLGLRMPDRLVLGCDQVLGFKGKVLEKPVSQDDARAQIEALSGQTHQLYSAAVIYAEGGPIWRHVGVARLVMRPVSTDYLGGYLARNWPAIAESVGGYKLEEEGVRLFSQIQGDYFTILGMPLLELLNYLVLRGEIEG